MAIALFRRKNSVARLILLIAVYSLFLASLVGIHTWWLDELGHFHAAYRQIKVGMTVAEVRAIVDAHFPGRKMTVQVHPGGCFVGPLDPNDGAYNAEFFEVGLKDGIVISKQYLPD